MRAVLLVLATSFCLGCGSKPPAAPTPSQQADTANLERDPEIRARMLIDIAAQQRAIKDTPGAATTSSMALRAAEQIKDPGTKAEVLLIVAKQLADAESRIEANKAIESAQVAVATIDDKTAKVRATIALADAVFAFEPEKTRARAADKILGGAETLVEVVPRPDDKIPLLAELAVMKGKIGGGDVMKPLVAQATEQAAAIPDVKTRVRVQGLTAARFYDGGAIEAGRVLFEAAAASAAGLADPQARGYALVGIVEDLGGHRTKLPQLGQILADAEAAARQVKDQGQQVVLLQKIQAVRTAPR